MKKMIQMYTVRQKVYPTISSLQRLNKYNKFNVL